MSIAKIVAVTFAAIGLSFNSVQAKTIHFKSCSGQELPYKSVKKACKSGNYPSQTIVKCNKNKKQKKAKICPASETNSIPSAGSQSLTVNQGDTLDIFLSGSDSDGDKLTFELVSQPRHGNLNGNGKRYQYTPASGYAGSDLFSFKTYDGRDYSPVALVSLDIKKKTIILPTGQYIPVCGLKNNEFNSYRNNAHLQNSNAVFYYDGQCVKDVVASGNMRFAPEAKAFEDEIFRTIAKNSEQFNNIRNKLFNLSYNGTPHNNSLTNITWDPSGHATFFDITMGINHSILQTNAVSRSDKNIYKKTIAVAGYKDQTPYLYLGSNPFRTENKGLAINDEMYQFMDNSIEWLTNRQDLKSKPFKVVIAHINKSTGFPDEVETRSWLQDHFGKHISINDEDLCNDDNLAGCLSSDADLLIISQHDAKDYTDDQIRVITNSVKQAFSDGIPVLYLHQYNYTTALGSALTELVDISISGGNNWSALQLKNYANEPQSGFINQIKNLVAHLHIGDYNFNWIQCDNTKGNTKYTGKCEELDGMASEFLDAATALKKQLNKLDNSNVKLFESEGNYMLKTLILLGDKYRQDVVFPMTIGVSDDTELLKSYFADHVAYYSREHNAVQTDLGTYSRTNFDGVKRVTKIVERTSTRYMRSTGVYAIPGDTITITRLDDSEIELKAVIGTVRPGSTRIWGQGENSNYNRPRFITSPDIKLEKGKPVVVTSPYGGPVQLRFNQNDIGVKVKFENVGQHPYWRMGQRNSDLLTEINKNEFDWVEVVTDGFEVHSKTDHLLKSINKTYKDLPGRLKWNDINALVAGIIKYTYNYPHTLAGYQGDGIEEVAEITQFINKNGWELDTMDIVKHMNADQSSCGGLCSGNPYDSYGNFDPTGHGDLHEFGHGLQHSMTIFDNWTGHDVTGIYSSYTKTREHGNLLNDTGEYINTSCYPRKFKSLFELLKSSQKSRNPFAVMSKNKDFHGAVLMELAMAAQDQSWQIKNGWSLITLSHIMRREFNKAIKSEELWSQQKNKLGFSQYTLDEAKKVGNNDWNAIVYSKAARKDYRDYMKLMGIGISNKASQQIASFNYGIIKNRFYISSNDGYCMTGVNGDYLDKAYLVFDSNAVWPEETDTDGDGYWDALDRRPNDINRH